MRLFIRLALVALVGGHVLVNGLGCSSSDDDDHGGGGQAGSESASLDDVIYEGEVTDEALESMLGGTVSIDSEGTKAPLASAPADQAVVPAATPFTFTWAASTASLSPSLRRLPPSLTGPRLPAWLGAERSAHAHGAPFTGIAYFVVFSTASNGELLRVATDKTSYTPDDSAWAKLKAAGGPITLTLTTARLEQNLLAAGGGPFTSAKGVTFTVQ